MMMASETFEVYQVNDVRCGKLDGKIRALQDTMPLHVDDLPDDIPPLHPDKVDSSRPPLDVAGHDGLVGRPLEEVEKYYIQRALEITGGKREEAAEMLGIGERTLYRKIKEWGLT